MATLAAEVDLLAPPVAVIVEIAVGFTDRMRAEALLRVTGEPHAGKMATRALRVE